MSETTEGKKAPETAASPARSPFLAGTLLVAVLAGLARVGLLALGRAFVNAVESTDTTLLVRDSVLVVATTTAVVFAIRFARHRKIRLTSTWPATLAVLALVIAGWKMTQRRAPYHDFYGVWTESAGQTWVETRPNLPKVTYRHDPNGFRGAGFAEQKAPGQIRIALVGDSFIFGQGVEENETLKARLDELFAARGLAGKVEVLNLGIPGANLETHVKMYALATQKLGADAVVMGLFEDNDLTAWDVQDEINDLAGFTPFSLGCFLLDERPAVVFATLLSQIRGGASAVAAFEEIEPTLAKLREADGAPPLVVLDYFTHHPEIPARLATRANVSFIPTTPNGRPQKDYHIPRDGHPSASGNRAYAALVMEKLEALPLLQKALSTP
ncbi:MAG: SGNH/GDSL hydrolase family protein [Byssovorax sp.]